MLIYKIFRGPEWKALQENGRTYGAPIDLEDGYIHFSTAAQATETAAKYFSQIQGLWLVAFDTEAMGDALKWEPSRGGDLFPHLYRPLVLDEVVWAKPLPFDAGQHNFPAAMV